MEQCRQAERQECKGESKGKGNAEDETSAVACAFFLKGRRARHPQMSGKRKSEIPPKEKTVKIFASQSPAPKCASQPNSKSDEGKDQDKPR